MVILRYLLDIEVKMAGLQLDVEIWGFSVQGWTSRFQGHQYFDGVAMELNEATWGKGLDDKTKQAPIEAWHPTMFRSKAEK
jgi:hypothetical protein